MRNQLSSTPANRSHIKSRIRAEASANAGIVAEVKRSGGSIYRQFHGLNAFAARLSKTERSQLAKSSQVARWFPTRSSGCPASTPACPARALPARPRRRTRSARPRLLTDGLDINNPDFIRPDGSHVLIDCKDFSGDGPNAPSDALEAFGDASSIAAQGRETYDISKFVNPEYTIGAK